MRKQLKTKQSPRPKRGGKRHYYSLFSGAILVTTTRTLNTKSLKDQIKNLSKEIDADPVEITHEEVAERMASKRPPTGWEGEPYFPSLWDLDTNKLIPLPPKP